MQSAELVKYKVHQIKCLLSSTARILDCDVVLW